MPRKKKSNLYLFTRVSKQNNLKYLSGNLVDRLKRLEINRKCSAASRRNKTDEQQESERHSQSFINDTNEQHMRRLTSDRNQHMFTRSIESDEHRVKRLAHDCDHSVTKKFESEVAYENCKKVAQENYYTLRNKNEINLDQNKKKELKKFVEMKMISNIKEVYLLMLNGII
jgi:hypothetical protein